MLRLKITIPYGKVFSSSENVLNLISVSFCLLPPPNVEIKSLTSEPWQEAPLSLMNPSKTLLPHIPSFHAGQLEGNQE